MLAAKAVVIGWVTFIAGLAGGTAALLLGERLLRSPGNFVLPVTALTEVRVVAGTAALFAVAAMLALALGTILRHGAGAVTAVIVAIVRPYFFATALPVLPASAADWLLRVTPAAAFAIQQTIPRYPQVSGRTRRRTATSRWRRGPASLCCAAMPCWPWPWPSSCSGGETHEPRQLG